MENFTFKGKVQTMKMAIESSKSLIAKLEVWQMQTNLEI